MFCTGPLITFGVWKTRPVLWLSTLKSHNYIFEEENAENLHLMWVFDSRVKQTFFFFPVTRHGTPFLLRPSLDDGKALKSCLSAH